MADTVTSGDGVTTSVMGNCVAFTIFVIGAVGWLGLYWAGLACVAWDRPGFHAADSFPDTCLLEDWHIL